jgi:peptide/nickel transport system permease protein
VTETYLQTRQRPVRALLGSVSGAAGALLFLLTVAVAFLGPLVAPHSPTALVGPPRAGLSADHPLGTDTLGRDVLSRVLHGGLDAVVVPTLAVVVAFLVGASVGMWSGYAGGRRDTVLARLVDVLIALPPMLLAIVFVSAFGSSTWILVAVTAIFFVPRIIRIVRGATASVAAEDFVTAARLRGEPASTILRREIMPSLSGLLLVEFAGRLSNVVIFVATLNFLGLGAQPPSSSWGLMVNETKNLLRANAFAPLVPALLIAALAVGVSLLADQLAKVLDGGAR